MEQNTTTNQCEANTNLFPHYYLQDLQLSNQNSFKITRRTKTSRRVIERILTAKKATSYYWTNVENKRYILFLSNNPHLFGLSEQDRRIQKINLQMSKKVRTRTPTQCHTHHQKMMKKFGSIPNIIANLKISQDCLQSIPEEIPEHIPQPRRQQAQLPPLQGIVPELKKQPQSYPYLYALFGDELILGRFENQFQEYQYYHFDSHQLSRWMSDLGL